MALRSTVAAASIKRPFTSSNSIRRMSSPISNAGTSAPPQKTWISKWVQAPKRPMTDGEYAFLQATKMAAVGIGGAAYISGLAYITFIRPYPARMMQLMAELPPADAQRLWEREHEVHIPPRFH